MRAEAFKRWKPYVPDSAENAPEEPRKAVWWWSTPEQEADYDRAERAAHKGKAPASETSGRLSAPRRPDAVRIEEVSFVQFVS